MKLTEIEIRFINESDWNPNHVDPSTLARLRASIERFGVVEPLVVREISPHQYVTIGGAQRLVVIKELGFETVDCVVVETDDADSRLLAQALNRIAGTDDPVKQQTSLDMILENIPRGEVLELLPDAVNSIGQAITFSPLSLIEHLEIFEKSRSVQLKHFSAQLTSEQLTVIYQAITHASEHGVVDEANPNKTGNALFYICQIYLSSVQNPIDARL